MNRPDETTAVLHAAQKAIDSALLTVRRRQRIAAAFRGLSIGLLTSGLICVSGAMLRFLAAAHPPAWWILAVVWSLPVAAAASAVIWYGSSWKTAARAVDCHFGLQDRIVTAIEFLANAKHQPEMSAGLHRLQIHDALLHLSAVDARQCIPLKLSRHAGWYLALMMLGSLLWLKPLPVAAPPEKPEMSPGIAEAARRIESDLMQLEQLAENTSLHRLRPMLKDLRKQLENLRHAEVQTSTALASISEMQQKLHEQQAQLNLSLINSKLSAMSEAMSDVSALHAASEAIQNHEFSKAARAMEKVRPRRIDPTEAAQAAARLQEVAEAMKDAGLSELSEEVAGLSEGLREKDDERIVENSRRLAESLDQHEYATQIASLLQEQTQRLAEYKTLARKTSVAANRPDDLPEEGIAQDSGTEPGGDSQSADTGSSSAAGGSGKSAGASSVGNIHGPKTSLESSRQLARLTGQLTGQGNNDKELVRSAESQQEPRRQVSEVLAEYERRSEQAVLTENIPFGHRETIRRYFQLLRTSANSAPENSAAANPSETDIRMP